MNLSALSREDLLSELLSPLDLASGAGPLRVSDVAPQPEMSGTRGAVLAHRLEVARELLLRDLRERMRRGPLMNSPQVIRDWLRLYCARLDREVFLVLYLDAQHQLIEAEELFRGTLTQTSVYPREVVNGALARDAGALALAHFGVRHNGPDVKSHRLLWRTGAAWADGLHISKKSTFGNSHSRPLFDGLPCRSGHRNIKSSTTATPTLTEPHCRQPLDGKTAH